MPSPYPAEYDTFAHAYPDDLADALLKVEHRLGKEREEEPVSLEDRLHTVENLLVDLLARVPLPVKVK